MNNVDSKQPLPTTGLQQSSLVSRQVEESTRHVNENPTSEGVDDEQMGQESNYSAAALNEDKEAVGAQGHQTNPIQGTEENVEKAPTADQAQARLDQLRRQQKKLKQKNDIANLRNIIHRQRGLLKAQGRELTENSSQLQACVEGIKSKHKLLDESEKRLEEMNHRKRIVEGMVLRATEQLMGARKVLDERRRQNNA